jgi:predicted transcriptional regulator
MKTTNDGHVLLLSIQPKYANLIFEGTKTIELRRVRPRVAQGDFVLIYVSSPDKVLLGNCQVEQVIGNSPKMLWNLVRDKSGLKKADFLEYFEGVSTGYAIVLNQVQKFNQPIIWIDADSVVNELPLEFDNIDADVACVEKANGCPESALIYFNNTEKSINFIKTWMQGCAVDAPELDHPVLKQLWYGSSNEKRKSLPDSVCSVRTNSKVTIILSKTEGKREHTRLVMNRREKEGKIL